MRSRRESSRPRNAAATDDDRHDREAEAGEPEQDRER